MRHLFVTNDFPPKLGGIESYVTSLCKGFDPDDVAVVAPAREGHEAIDAELPYRVVRVAGSRMRATGRVYRAIHDAVASFDPAAVHFLAALPLGRLGERLRRETGKPFTVIAHGSGEILVPSKFPVTRRRLRSVLTAADVVLPVSEFTQRAVERFTQGRAATTVVHPTVDIERFSLTVSGAAARAKHSLRAGFTVLFVSRLVKRKGADILIRALDDVPDTTLLLVGTGSQRAALGRLAERFDVVDRVVFAGSVSDDDLPGYYAASDVFCMPCTDRYGGLDTEGFGIVYLEAQAVGLPVVAGHCGGSVEAVTDGVSGVVLKDPEPADVAEALETYRTDEALRARVGASGRELVERAFAPQVAARRLTEVVEALASGSGPTDA